MVYGSRFLQRHAAAAPWLTIAANRFLTGVTNVLYGRALTDMETCYKVMRTEVARALELEANRFDIEPEITAKLLRAGHTIVERPVRFEPRSRAQGKKIGWRDGVKRDLASSSGIGSLMSSQPRSLVALARGALRVVAVSALARRHVGGRRLRLVVLRLDGRRVCAAARCSRRRRLRRAAPVARRRTHVRARRVHSFAGQS